MSRSRLAYLLRLVPPPTWHAAGGKHHYNLYVVSLHSSHVIHDPDNPQAELRALCPACHLRYDWRTAPPRSRYRPGYRPLTLARLRDALLGAGLSLIPDAAGSGINWQIADLTGHAVDVLDAITCALHWLAMNRPAHRQESQP